ncbi:MAG: DinB superfamily protein [candidate division NC10 bacterium]|jgi:hypothetical protein|nr:DinB superfamily protein [candidate division NC10 bacterium]
MRSVADQLSETARAAKPRLLSISDARASEKPYADTWSLKEILGHLVDSAANNHQRIVRMQEVRDIGVFRYAQQHWADSQKYQARPWEAVVELWFQYNLHLAHIIGQVDPKALEHVCDMGYANPATLAFVIEDYLRHVKHHLAQVFSDKDPREREKWISRDPGKAPTP